MKKSRMIYYHSAFIIFHVCGIFLTPMCALEEELVVPFPYVLSYSFVIVTNLIDEFVVGTVGLVLVGGKITVRFAVLVDQHGWIRRIFIEWAVCAEFASICAVSCQYFYDCLFYSFNERSEMIALIVFEEDFLAFGLQQLNRF